MKSAVCGATALLMSAGIAQAGGVERTAQSVMLVYEQGNRAELTFGSVRPEISGKAATPLLGTSSGNMSENYLSFGAAVKYDINDRLAFALIYDQPYGADVDYSSSRTYFAAGSTAELDSWALTAVLKYKLTDRFSVHGGLRYQSLGAKATIPFVAGVNPLTGAPLPGVTAPGTPYEADGKSDTGLGYLIGVAYEMPDIALRVALTYNSRIRHELSTTETTALGNVSSTTSVDSPQSVNLEFQTGIAADTLLFGSVRWVDWSEFDISPKAYLDPRLGGQPLVSYEDDTVTYTLGVGRRFNEKWAGSVAVSYEPANGNYASNLGPKDGFWALRLGASYTMDNMEISGGVQYAWIGDTETRVGPFAPATKFEDNSALGIGLKVAFKF